MFFKINDKSVVKSVDFLEEIGTLYDFFFFLLDNSMRIITSTEVQTDFLKAITVLKIITSNMKTDITVRVKDKKRKFLQNKKMF